MRMRGLAYCAGLSLKEYQLVGLNWLWLMWRMRLGGILADEMGLGKTVQVVALLCAIADDRAATGRAHAPHMMVAPSSTLDNWVRELRTWAPSLRSAKYHGAQARRAQLQEELDTDGFDVLVVPYTYFEGDSQAGRADRAWLHRRTWGLAVFDEAHALKKPSSARYQRLGRLRAAQRLLLTGTPVQNNLPELLSMLSFMMPSAFPPSLATASRVLAAGSAAGDNNGAQIARARRMLAPFVLRRLKADVLPQMVGKTEEEHCLKMSERQLALYKEKLAEAKAQCASSSTGGGAEGGRCAGKRAAATARSLPSARNASALFSTLRRASNHPCLLQSWYAPEQIERIARSALATEYFGGTATLPKVRAELAKYSDFGLHQVAAEVGESALALPKDVLFSSAKFVHLQKVLPTLRDEGHRALIFSQVQTLPPTPLHLALTATDKHTHSLYPTRMRTRTATVTTARASKQHPAPVDASSRPHRRSPCLPRHPALPLRPLMPIALAPVP